MLAWLMGAPQGQRWPMALQLLDEFRRADRVTCRKMLTHGQRAFLFEEARPEVMQSAKSD